MCAPILSGMANIHILGFREVLAIKTPVMMSGSKIFRSPSNMVAPKWMHKLIRGGCWTILSLWKMTRQTWKIEFGKRWLRPLWPETLSTKYATRGPSVFCQTMTKTLSMKPIQDLLRTGRGKTRISTPIICKKPSRNCMIM